MFSSPSVSLSVCLLAEKQSKIQMDFDGIVRRGQEWAKEQSLQSLGLIWISVPLQEPFKRNLLFNNTSGNCNDCKAPLDGAVCNYTTGLSI